jgi:hypothetical protein
VWVLYKVVLVLVTYDQMENILDHHGWPTEVLPDVPWWVGRSAMPVGIWGPARSVVTDKWTEVQ